MTLDVASTSLLANMAVDGAPPLHTLSPTEARAAFSGLAQLNSAGPEMKKATEVEIKVAGGESIRGRLLHATETPRAVFVYFHGGVGREIWY